MRKIALPLAFLILTGCQSPFFSSPDSLQDSSSSSSEPVTRDVSYVGQIEQTSAAKDVSFVLVRETGDSVWLKSDVIPLEDFAKQRVEVTGSVRPGNGNSPTIMTVDSVLVLDAVAGSGSHGGLSGSTLSAASKNSSSLSSQISSSISSSQISVLVKSSEVPLPPTPSSEASSIQVPSSSSIISISSIPSSSSVSSDSTAFLPPSEIALKMSKDDLSPSRWTQNYCSSNVGFCFPVNKNWWYKSFGAVKPYVWHVEISSREINALGEGIISVNIVAGPLPADVGNGDIKKQGDLIIAYREWTNGNHIEITGPAILDPAIRYIARSFSEFAPAPVPAQ